MGRGAARSDPIGSVARRPLGAPGENPVGNIVVRADAQQWPARMGAAVMGGDGGTTAKGADQPLLVRSPRKSRPGQVQQAHLLSATSAAKAVASCLGSMTATCRMPLALLFKPASELSCIIVAIRR